MGTRAGRDVPCAETLRAEAAIAARIDDALADADFTDVSPPDFTAVTPDPRRVLAALATRTGVGNPTHTRLAAELAELNDNVEPADKTS